MAIDWGQVGVLVGNFGAMAGLIKVYASKIDKSADVLPAVTEALKTVTKSLEKAEQNLQELYASRNSHALAIERLKMTHRLKGCDLPPEKEHEDET